MSTINEPRIIEELQKQGRIDVLKKEALRQLQDDVRCLSTERPPTPSFSPTTMRLFMQAELKQQINTLVGNSKAFRDYSGEGGFEFHSALKAELHQQVISLAEQRLFELLHSNESQLSQKVRAELKAELCTALLSSTVQNTIKTEEAVI